MSAAIPVMTIVMRVSLRIDPPLVVNLVLVQSAKSSNSVVLA